MKKTVISLFAVCLSPVFGEPLDEELKSTILKEVQVILYEEEAYLIDKAKEAKKILEKAAEKESSAMALYYEAVQKVNYTDKDKKASEFLEWKNKNRDKLTSFGFRKLVELELKWMALATDAYRSASHEDIEKLSENLVSYLDEYYTELGTIEGNFAKAKNKTANKNNEKSGVGGLLKSEVAQFLDLDDLEIKDWPVSPTDLDTIYEKFVLPISRTSFDQEGIRKAWEKRLEHEALFIQAYDMENKGGIQGGGREKNTKAMQNYLKSEYPILVWTMYNDFYRYGGQKEGAQKMISHIKEYEDHPRRKEWAEQLLTLLDPLAVK